MKQINSIRISCLTLFLLLIAPSVIFSQSRLDSIVDLGDDLVALNDYKQAENKYDQALELDEGFIPALEGKINVLLLMDKFSKAEKVTEQAIERYPLKPSFEMYMGKVLIERGAFQDALPHLNKAAELADQADSLTLNKVFVTMGAAYQKLGDSQQAMEQYSKALSINNSNPNVFLYRGNLYYQRESYGQAVTDFKRVLELDPNNHVAQYNLGMCYFKQGEKKNACDSFHKACELGNTNACKMVISKCLRSTETQ